MNPTEVTAQHRSRLACVYIRQSSPHQVEHHKESQRRQRALVEQATRLGWPSANVIEVDEDLGQSAVVSSRRRMSFEALVAEVVRGKIGLILAIEVSRLARANRDWYYLMDICAVTRTLIADGEGLYDPKAFNDRLLLGLKATFSEAEIHFMTERLVGAVRSKAERGEFQIRLPASLEWDELGRIRKSPDEQVVAVTQLVFQRFLELGTVNQTLVSLAEDRVLLPIRCGRGGRIEWKLANYDRVYNILTHPFLAGAYAHGRRQSEEFLDDSNRPVKRQRQKDQEDWYVLIKDHHEGYISWETFERIQEQIAANRRCPAVPGAPREGRALLQGLVLCGRCGRKMRLRYGKGGGLFRYECARGKTIGIPICQGFGGKRLEHAVETLVLEALEPLGIEAMIRAATLHDEAHEARRRHWQQRIERTRYEVEVARRQYDAIDPTNRLVARELEKRFEAALKALEETKAEAEVHMKELDLPLAKEDQELLRRYARDLPSLWNAPSTRPQDKKRILRCLIRHVVLTAAEEVNKLKAKIHWSGGEVSEVEVPRGKSGVNRNATGPEVIELVRNLAQEFSDQQIARILHRRHIRTATGLTFNARRVMLLRREYDIPRGPKVPAKGDDIYTAEEAAEILGVCRGTVIRWVEAGLLKGRQRSAGAPWRIRVSEEDRKRLLAAEAPKEWLPLKGAAQALGVSQQTVLQRLKAGKLEGVRVQVGRRSGWRIRVPETSYYKQLTLF